MCVRTEGTCACAQRGHVHVCAQRGHVCAHRGDMRVRTAAHLSSTEREGGGEGRGGVIAYHAEGESGREHDALRRVQGRGRRAEIRSKKALASSRLERTEQIIAIASGP